jgi:hypothetical protein
MSLVSHIEAERYGVIEYGAEEDICVSEEKRNMGVERWPKVEFYDFFCSPSIRLVKSRRMR